MAPGGHRIEQGLRRVERIGAGLLGHHAFQGGERGVLDAIARHVAGDVAEGDAQRQVGVRVDEFALAVLVVGHRLQVDRSGGQVLAGAGLALLLELEQRGHHRHRVLDRRIGAGLERGAVGRQPLQAFFGAAQRGSGQAVERTLDCGRIVAAQPGVDRGHALGRRQLEILLEPVRLQLAVHRGHVAALQLPEPALDRRQVALLVTGLALGIGLGAFDRQPVQLAGGAQHGGVVEHAQGQVALARGLALLEQGQQPRVRVQRGLALGPLPLQPGQHRRFLGTLLPGRIDALEAGELALVILAGVVPAGHGAGVLDLDLRIELAGRLHQCDLVLEVAGDGRIAPLRGIVEFGRQRIAVGRTRVAGDHDEITFAQRLVGELQPVPGLERHVVGRVRRRLAILADIGAVEGEIAGVARPHPVVDVAAELADAARGRIGQAHVADFHVAEQAIAVAAGEAVQPAAEAGLGFTFCNQLLLERFQCLRARQRIGAGRGDHRLGVAGHVGDLIEHEHPRIGSGTEFVGGGRRIEAIADQVVLGRGIELDGAVGAVVVGRHQAIGRHEAGRAATQSHHRPHRIAGQVGQLLRRQLQPGLGQRPGDLWQLLRHPHALAGDGGGDGSHCGQDGKGKKTQAHGFESSGKVLRF